MGDALMKQVMRDWGHLPGNQYKVLMVMAACAMDDGNPPIYFGGWERLAVTGLGRTDWPADSDQSLSAQKVRDSCYEVVRRVLAALCDEEKVGAVAVHRPGRPGTRAEYALTLNQRFVGTPPNETLGPSQQIVVDRARIVGANYQDSQHSQAQNPTSPKSLRHQGPRSAVDKARSTPESLALRRAQLAEQEVAS